MTLDEWMNSVVADFPQQLQHHLRTEYREHYQDHLAAGGREDALALFGDPAETKRQLNKIYLPQVAIERPSMLVPLMAGLLILDYAILVASFFPFPQHTHIWSAPGLVVVPVGVVWLWKYTSKWAPERQKLFRSSLLPVLLFMTQTFLMLGSDGLIFQSLAYWGIVVSLIAGVYFAFTTDVRVRRTLNPKDWRDA